MRWFMAGYNGYSKSNNAIRAEEEGKFPASTLAKRIKKYFKGIRAEDIRQSMITREYHHCSKRYNIVDYFDITDLIFLKNRQKLRETIFRRIMTAKFIKIYKYEPCWDDASIALWNEFIK